MKSTANNITVERGILTSSYKQEIKENIKNMRAFSIYKAKQHLNNQKEMMHSNTGLFLKASPLFLILITLFF